MAASQVPSVLPAVQLEEQVVGEAPNDGPVGPVHVRHRMSTRNRLLFFATAWLIVLMPFLFWWNTWFGRHLSDQQLSEFLHDSKKPRHIQQALVQISERILHHDAV